MSHEALAIIIFVVCIVLFITQWVNTCVAAAMGCVAFVIFGICDFSTAFAGLSNALPVMIFGSLVVGDAMSQTGLDEILGEAVVRISRNNERIFIFLAGLVSGLLSMWMSNTAVVACFLPIIASVAASSHMTMKNMTMSITFGAMFGGACTLVGSTSQMAVQGIMTEMSGDEFHMFTLMPVGLIMLAVFLVYIQLFGYRLGIRIWDARAEEGIREVKAHELDPSIPEDVMRKKRIRVIVIFACMVILYILNLFPTQITALMAALACFVFRCSDPKKAVNNIDWNCILFLACTMGLANGLMETGVPDLLADGVRFLLGSNVNPYIFLLIVTVISIVTSNFLANATTCVIITPIVVAACQNYGFRVLPFCLAIAYAASTTCMTPMAHAQVTMTMVAGYRFTDYTKYNFPITLLTITCIMVFVPAFFPLVG